jgi:hypothetical protein
VLDLAARLAAHVRALAQLGRAHLLGLEVQVGGTVPEDGGGVAIHEPPLALQAGAQRCLLDRGEDARRW